MEVVRIAAIVGTKLYIDGGSLWLSLNAPKLSKDFTENSSSPALEQHTRILSPSFPGMLTIGNN